MQHTTNCSSDSSKSSLFTPRPPGCSTGDNGFLTTTDRTQISNNFGLSICCSRTVFHEEVDIDLLQRNSHTGTFDVG